MQLCKHGRRPRTRVGDELGRPLAGFGVALPYQRIEFGPIETGFRKCRLSEFLDDCPAWHSRSNYRAARALVRCMLTTRFNQIRQFDLAATHRNLLVTPEVLT